MRGKCRGAIAWVLILVMTVSPSLAAQPASAQPAKAPGSTPAAAAPVPATSATHAATLDLGFVTPDTALAVVLQSRRVLVAPESEMLPTEVFSAMGIKELGIDPLQIEQILLIGEPPTGGPPGVGIVVRMAGPLAEGPILAPLWERTKDAELGGKKYRQGQGMLDPSIYRADDRTLIVAHQSVLEKMLENHAKPQEGPMSRVLARIPEPPDAMAILLVEPLRPLASLALGQVPLPPELAGVKKIPGLVNMIAARANLIGQPVASLAVRAKDAAAAAELEGILDGLLATARDAAAANAARMLQSEDPVQQAMGKYSQRTTVQMMDLVRPARRGETFSWSTDGQGNAKGKLLLSQTAVIGILFALLLPAVQSARSAARRAQSSNNLRQIGLAMMMFNDAKGTFPARASFDKAAKPLLSWRVHLLPYLGQDDLYKRFHLDEPWDSDHNRQLIPLMPPLYRSAAAPAQPGKANYLAVAGKGMLFEGDKGRKLRDLRDGLSNTIMVVEADSDHAVTWTSPEDWQPADDNPVAGLADPFDALFADGSVRFISKTVDPKVFRAMLTIAGGEEVNPQ